MIDVNNFDILKKYLVERKIIDDNSPVIFEPLSGGVSNSVLKISSGTNLFVLKQALQKLKVKSEWISDIARTNVEKQALKFLPQIIPGFTPRLLYEDEENYLFLMECAPESSVTWKSLLMNQYCNPRVAAKVGEILGRLHNGTFHSKEARELFKNKKYFYELRIEPFFEFLTWNHPDLEDNINRHVQNCLNRESCIVIGDYSPKNILVDGENVMVIDFEVIHYGDPSFDLGFLTTHLLLKSLKFKASSRDYYNILQETVNGYFSCIQFGQREELEQLAVHQLAWLLLARVDGKSPAEYITEERDKQMIRGAGKEILHSNIKSYQEVIELFNLKMKQN